MSKTNVFEVGDEVSYIPINKRLYYKIVGVNDKYIILEGENGHKKTLLKTLLRKFNKPYFLIIIKKDNRNDVTHDASKES